MMGADRTRPTWRVLADTLAQVRIHEAGREYRTEFGSWADIEIGLRVFAMTRQPM